MTLYLSDCKIIGFGPNQVGKLWCEVHLRGADECELLALRGLVGALNKAVEQERLVFQPPKKNGGPKRVYLGSRYSRLAEMQNYANELRQSGIIVDAAWLTGEMGDLVGKTSRPEGDPEAVKAAEHDMADIRAADVAVIFIDAPGPNNRGGYHVEFGIALQRGIPLLLVGKRVNSFNHLPQVQYHPTWESARAALIGKEAPEHVA